MTHDEKFSNEFLNAFVDNQLTPEEKSRAYPAINQDERLAKRVCELSKLTDLVKLAYKNPPQYRTGTSDRKRGRGFGPGIAAGIALLVGALLGWSAHGPWDARDSDPGQKPVATTTSSAEASLAADPGTAATDATAKVLFHVGTSEILRMEQTLSEAESLLKFYRKTGQQARVEVVANGDGLNMLTASSSPFADIIARMQKEYPNVAFVACQNTIDRYADNGVDARLLPGIVVIDSGVAQIMRRQQQGWAYIQV